MAEKPNLNSLDRFRKHPGRLVLEEHGHCEVPSGCGGVVLRWRDPFASVPVTFHLYTPGNVAAFLDGNPMDAMRSDLAPGRHAFAFLLEDYPTTSALVMFAVRRFPERYGEPKAPTPGVPTPAVVSRGDGAWRYTTETPPPEWRTVAFDDSGWAALVEVPISVLPAETANSYQVERLTEYGAACLGTRAPLSGPVWVRHVFAVSTPDNPG